MIQASTGGRLSWIIRGLTLLIAFLSPPAGSLGIAMVLLALGIPHGAADHLIFRSRQSAGSAFSVFAFAVYYVGVIGSYTLIWWWWPAVALLLFLAVSVYHFGQPHGGNLADRLLWGTFVLGFPVLYHYPQAEPIITGMLGYRVDLPAGWSGGIPALLVTANVSFALLNRQWARLLDLVILVAVYLGTDLLLGFAVFFLLWHSLPALVEQWRYLTRHRLTRGWSTYLLQLLPLSLGAFVSMGVAYLLLHARGPQTPDLSYLFIMVSLITLPHALLVDRVYRP
ncbi:Brp/Blh family beta-carotene 15,15'-dioxygenase [Lewinella sp. IMCC34191]|uniref:Brp/Blh family beta-carotene 15,15'-dioxygenase n=1 Tax=Lewinella sp. IMCC34191 TaxID=2259172 RepID=UPI000E26B856|nr:Brp/Blh family beta-carotene 15,15'-dioxygenase [Lewinella sp. IMCC34191]